MAHNKDIQKLKLDIPISQWLESQGYRRAPQKGNADEIWFYSPFHRDATGQDEGTPSFKVIEGQRGFQVFKDHGSYAPGRGGDIFNLIQELKGTDFKGAVAELQGQSFDSSKARPQVKTKQSGTLGMTHNNRLKFLNAFDFNGGKGDYYQLQYIQSRGIDKNLAPEYLKRVKYRHTQRNKDFWACGWSNRSDGWDIRAKAGQYDVKACLMAKDITLIGFDQIKPGQEISRVSLFEGMFDYLTVLTWSQKKALEGSTIILNGNGLASRALEFLEDYQVNQIVTYFDNDKGGQETTLKTAEWGYTQEALFGSMSYLWEGYKDANEMHIQGVIPKVVPNPISKEMRPKGAETYDQERLAYLATRPAITGFEL